MVSRQCAYTPCSADISHKRRDARYCDRKCKNAAMNVRLRKGSEEERVRNRERYVREADRRRAYAREQYRQDPEASRAYSRAWRAANPAKRQAQSANRRAAKRNNPGYVGVTAREWERMKARYGHRCAHCGCLPDGLHMDHVVPLARGGRHAPANVLPSCPTCNTSRGSLLLTEWRLRKIQEGR